MSIRIGLTISEFPFSSPRAFRQWVELCEESDIDSIWQTDRLVSEVPYLEPLSLMAWLASATERLKFGMNVAVLGLREPLVLAKQCATIDFLSEGRLLPAFGVGADGAPEWSATGTSPAGRGSRADEALGIIARLWAGERVTFTGSHYSYQEARIAPLPVQQPLPLWIGGSSPAAIRRTARLGTGWIAGLQTPDTVSTVISAIKAAAVEAGRVIDEDHYGAGFSFRFGSWEDEPVRRAVAAYARVNPTIPPEQYMAVGDERNVLARLQEFIDAGASKFVLRPLADGDADFTDQTRALATTVVPTVHHPAG